ncbi:MAG: FG-GAP repeat protein, partial [Herpetosiphonaceae bacterium]|nr:FG-GAP repeat protein [Herpetosiphonaceae bacterium]
TWTQQAYLKASNPETIDLFGSSVAVDGNTIVIGADREDSGATGVNGNQADNSADDSGAAYGFTRSGATWTPQAYLKATNAGAGDFFGSSVAVDGDTVVVGAPYEDSAATGVGADQTDNSAVSAGAIYSFSAGNLPTATPTIIVTPSVPTTTATTPATATASATPTVIVTPTTPTGAVSRIYLPLITVVAGP